MSILAERREIELNETGVATNVPNNATARCMYYLYCITRIIQFNNRNIDRYIDYCNYDLLGLAEKKIVIQLCDIFYPNKLIELGLFVRVNSLPDNSSNTFIEITSRSAKLYVDQSLLFGNYTVTVKKVMCFTQPWLAKNYFYPVGALRSEIAVADISSPNRPIYSIAYTNNSRVHPETTDSQTSNANKNCLNCFIWVCACICVTIVVLIIILVVTGSLTIERG